MGQELLSYLSLLTWRYSFVSPDNWTCIVVLYFELIYNFLHRKQLAWQFANLHIEFFDVRIILVNMGFSMVAISFILYIYFVANA